jgi:hypothetical protein
MVRPVHGRLPEQVFHGAQCQEAEKSNQKAVAIVPVAFVPPSPYVDHRGSLFPGSPSVRATPKEGRVEPAAVNRGYYPPRERPVRRGPGGAVAGGGRLFRPGKGARSGRQRPDGRNLRPVAGLGKQVDQLRDQSFDHISQGGDQNGVRLDETGEPTEAFEHDRGISRLPVVGNPPTQPDLPDVIHSELSCRPRNRVGPSGAPNGRPSRPLGRGRSRRWPSPGRWAEPRNRTHGFGSRSAKLREL